MQDKQLIDYYPGRHFWYSTLIYSIPSRFPMSPELLGASVYGRDAPRQCQSSSVPALSRAA